MKDSIIIYEDRRIVDAMNDWKVEQFKKIEQSEKNSSIIDKVFDITKGIVKVFDKGITLVTGIVPSLSGKFSKIATTLSSGAVSGVLDATEELSRTIFTIKEPGKMSAAFLDAYNNLKDISIPDRTRIVENPCNLIEQQEIVSEQGRSL